MDSKYREILVAAKRARQIEGGAPTLVETQSRKAARIALEEVRAGKIEYTNADEKTAPKQ